VSIRPDEVLDREPGGRSSVVLVDGAQDRYDRLSVERDSMPKCI